MGNQIGRIVALLGAKTITDARQKIDELIERIGCPVSLGNVGVEGDRAIAQLVDQVNLERLANNPRRIDAAALTYCLKERM